MSNQEDSASVTPSALINETPFVILDVETTGLRPQDGHRIIDISMIRWWANEIVDTFGTLINPGRCISPEAIAVHGILDADLVGAPLFSDIARHVWEFLQGAVIVAHNAEFDVRFINYELARAGYPQWNGVMIDTLAMARKLHQAKDNKLGAVAQRMGITCEKQHSAADDSMTTLLVFQAFVHCAGFQTIGNLLWAQGGRKKPPQAPTGCNFGQLQRSAA